MAGRNDEQHFSGIPTIDIQRSKFKRPFTHKTTFNMGKLIPFYVDSDVLPGDTHKFTTSMVIRLLDPAVPLMDNLYLDTYYFFIPSRLCWKNFKKHMGENTEGAWAQVAETERPHIIIPENGFDKDAVLTYMGIPQGAQVAGCTVDREAVTAYCLTWNEWFRDQNVTAPLQLNLDDGDTMGNNSDPVLGGKVLPVYKFHDAFTSALPQPQKGTAINMPLGISAPVYTGTDNPVNTSEQGLRLRRAGQSTGGMNDEYPLYIGSDSAQNTLTNINNAYTTGTPTNQFAPRNLYADLSQATAATVNALRLAFATQRILEKDARGGHKV